MTQKTAFSTITRTIPAGGEQKIDITGTFLTCTESDQSTFLVAIDDSARNIFASGMEMQVANTNQPYKSIRVINTDGSNPLTVSFSYGFGALRDRRFQVSGTLNANITNTNVKVIGASGDFDALGAVSIPTATAVTLVPYNFNRRRLLVFNNEPVGGETVYLGEQHSVTVANGFPLPPQQAIAINQANAIGACHGGAAAVDVRYINEVWA
jgi:hypothetical protein